MTILKFVISYFWIIPETLPDYFFRRDLDFLTLTMRHPTDRVPRRLESTPSVQESDIMFL